jgi:trigger factor
MTVAVPAARLEDEIATRLKRLSQKARFPGFRPGKAPMKMVEAQYGGQAMEEAVGDLIRVTFYEAVQTQGLKPAGGPNIEPKPINRGKDFEYTATFEVYPEVKRLEIKGHKIEKPVVAITDEDVNRTLDTLRRQRQTWKPVERTAQNGDRVLIDFEGSVNGEVFQGGTAKDFPLVLGSHALIDGFEDGIVGTTVGETRNLDLMFPAEYRSPELAGKKVQFAVTLKQVNEAVLPEVNDDFARAFGIADGNVDTLRAEVRANLEHEMADRLRRHVREQVFQALIDVNEFEIPKSLEDEEIARMIQTARQNFASQGLPAEQVPTDTALYAAQARSRVKLGLILAELANTRKLVADAAKVRARVEALASTYEEPKQFIEWHYAKPGRLAEIESLILEEQIIDLLMETAELADKVMSFQDLTKPTPRNF